MPGINMLASLTSFSIEDLAERCQCPVLVGVGRDQPAAVLRWALAVSSWLGGDYMPIPGAGDSVFDPAYLAYITGTLGHRKL